MERILRNENKWLDIVNDEKYEKIRKKIKNSFNKIVFVEEGHKYFLHGMEMECVSNVCHRFQKFFDTERIATETYERNFNNINSKYYQMTIEEIKAQWAQISTNACEDGTEKHGFGESCFYYMIGEYDKILPEFKDRLTADGGFMAINEKEVAIVKFFEDLPRNLIPLMAETRVYSENFGYAGTFDILFGYEKDGEILLYVMDFKTNADLYKNYAEKKLLREFAEYLDCPLNLYKIQLAAYQNCLEEIGLKIAARRIIWLKDNGTYEKINLENLTQRLKKALS